MQNKILGLALFLILINHNKTCGQKTYWSLGSSSKGLCFGNSTNYLGIRFNLRDKNVRYTSGINVSGITKCKFSNGFSVGLTVANDSICNGVKIGLIGTESTKINGVSVGGLFVSSDTFNGIGIAGLSAGGKVSNGLFISLFGLAMLNTDTIEKLNGVSIGGICGIDSKRLNGLAIGLQNKIEETQNGVTIGFYNRAKKLYGFQFGLINYAANNRKLFRWMPIMNFNLRKHG